MPTIAVVDGVKIRMFYEDHPPPHFHAVFDDEELLVAIRDVNVIRGSLPAAKLRGVLAWARGKQRELALNWTRCQQAEPLERIE